METIDPAPALPPAAVRPRLSVVLPAHNEAGNIRIIAARLAGVLTPLGAVGADYEIVFVDDCSTDATLAEIKALASADRRIRYLSFTRNFGHQAALRAGLQHARGAGVVVMDCDLEHPPELLPRLIEEWQAGAKIVTTRRIELPGQVTLIKRLTSRWFYRLFDVLGDVRIEPGSADFLLLDRVAVDAIGRFTSQDLFLRGLVRWLGYPMARVPYAQGARQAGESKFAFRRMVDFAVMGIVAHSVRPLRFAIHLSTGFALVAVLLFLYSLAGFLFDSHTVAGWTSLMAALALMGAGQFLVLGIIGEYVGRVLREVRGWPLYLIAETEAGPAGARPGERSAERPGVQS